MNDYYLSMSISLPLDEQVTFQFVLRSTKNKPLNNNFFYINFNMTIRQNGTFLFCDDYCDYLFHL